MKVGLLCLVTILICAGAASAQAWEAHAAAESGPGTHLVPKGLAFGGGVLIHDRVGIEADFGFLTENVVEPDAAPVLNVGATFRPIRAWRVLPIVSGGYRRRGDLGDLYAGGGVRIGLSPWSAIRFELRGAFPAADYRGCVPNCSSAAEASVSLRISVAFGPGS